MESNTETASFTTEDTKGSKIFNNFQVNRNLLCLSISFWLIFGEFHSLQSLQSSLYAEHGLGLSVLAILYVTAVLGLIVAPSIVNRFTAKRTIVLGFLIHTSFILIQFYPAVWLILPEGALIGFGSGFIWVAQFTYISTLASIAVKFKPISEDGLSKKLQKFNATFFAFYSLSGLMNIISSIVLTRENIHLPEAVISSNSSETPSVKNELDQLSNISKLENYSDTNLPHGNKCGTFYCPSEGNGEVVSQIKPKKASLRIYLIICLSMNILAILIFLLGADNIKEVTQDRKKSNHPMSTLNKLCKAFLESKYLLLVWPGIFKGVLQGLVFGTFPLVS